MNYGHSHFHSFPYAGLHHYHHHQQKMCSLLNLYLAIFSFLFFLKLFCLISIDFYLSHPNIYCFLPRPVFNILRQINLYCIFSHSAGAVCFILLLNYKIHVGNIHDIFIGSILDISEYICYVNCLKQTFS